DGKIIVANPNNEYLMSGGSLLSQHTYKSPAGDIVTISGSPYDGSADKLFDSNLIQGWMLGSSGTFQVLINFAEPMSLSKIEGIYLRADNGQYDMKKEVSA